MKTRALARMALAIVGAALMLGVLSASAPPVEAAADWWDSAWGYRYPIELTPQTDNVPINYVYRITLDISAELGGVIDDWDSIRWLENADNEELSFWREDNLPGDDAELDNAIFWIRRSDNDLTDNEIWLYISNPAAHNHENGDNTFIFFDDFSVDSTGVKWDVHAVNDSDAIWDEVNGELLIINPDDVFEDNGGAHTVEEFPRGLVAEFDMRWGDWYAWFGWNNDHEITSSNFSEGFYNNAGDVKWAVGDADTGVNTVTDNSADTEMGVFANLTGGMEIDGDRGTRLWTTDSYNSSAGATPLTLGFGTQVSTAYRIDNVRIRPLVIPEPGYTLGISEDLNEINLGIPTVTEALIDRDLDYATSGATLTTTISVQVTQLSPGEDVTTFADNYISLSIRDNNGAFVLDNGQPVSSVIDNDNAKTYTFAAFDPLDDTIDSALGGWDLVLIALDNFGNEDNSGYFTLFHVSDLTDNAMIQENIGGHSHTVSGDAGRPDHGAVALTSAWIVDNDNGTILCAISGAAYENTFYPVTDGTVYAIFQTAILDGTSDNDNLDYFYPNIPPEVISYSTDNTVIDRSLDWYLGGGDDNIEITVTFRDNDNWSDFIDLAIGLRDAADVAIDNENVYGSAWTVVDENNISVTYYYDASDNTLADAAMGAWDMAAYAADSWGAKDNWENATFSVDDLESTFVYAPDPPTFGWPVNVSGVISRVSGAGESVDFAIYYDVDQGISETFGAAGAWAATTYTLTSGEPGANIETSLQARDGGLDMDFDHSYLINTAMVYEIRVRDENGYDLIPENVADLGWELTVLWENGSSVHDIDNNPDNITVTGGVPYVATLDVDGAYWRRRVIENAGGILTFVIPENGAVIDFYTFIIEDYTSEYDQPDGWMSLRRYIDNDFAIISEDYWDATNNAFAHLIVDDWYEVFLFDGESNIRNFGHIQVENTDVLDPFVVSSLQFGENIVFRYSYLSFEFTRDQDTGDVIFRYADEMANTENVTLRIHTLDNAVQYSAEFILPATIEATWLLADNDTSYLIEAIVFHEDFGYSVEWGAVGAIWSQFVEAPPPGGVLGNDIPIAGLAGMILCGVVAMSFGVKHASTGMLAIPLLAIFLKFASTKLAFNLMPLDWPILIILLVLGATWKIGEGLK